MKVWIIEIGEPLPVIDSNARIMRAGMLAKALVAQGHKVTWWASTFDHFTKRHRFDGPRSVEVQPGLRLNLMHGPGYEKNISLKRLLHHRALARIFEQERQTQPKPDVVFACLPIPELAEKAAIYGCVQGVPVIIDVRDQWPDVYLMAFPSGLHRLARLVLLPEFRRTQRALRMATGITAVSETYLKWALNYAKRSMRKTDGVFPLGYPSPTVGTPGEIETQVAQLRARYKIRPDAIVVTFVGTFGAAYDLETVIKAARVLQEDDALNVQIVLAGDGDRMAKLREMVNGLENVVFTGWIDQIAISTLLHFSSVGLAAYCESALQSLPNKPFEYMAAGLPILSSLRGELESLIREERIGLQYQAGDVNSLVEQIRWLAANPEARREMGMRARRLFEERFSADVIYPRLVQYLEKVASQATEKGNVCRWEPHGPGKTLWTGS
ncbi:MAG: glycosyltransferase family 4 protein [Candidatus Methanomethylicaceae archaeon]